MNEDLVAGLSGPRWIEIAAAEYQWLRRWRWTPVRPPSPAAIRMRRTRQRRDDGLLCLRDFVVPEEISEVLVDCEFLDRLRADDPAAVREALQRLIAGLASAELPDDVARNVMASLTRLR